MRYSINNKRFWRLVGQEWGRITQRIDQVIVRRGKAVVGGGVYELGLMGLIDKGLIAAVGVDRSMGKDGNLLARFQGGVEAWRVIRRVQGRAPSRK